MGLLSVLRNLGVFVGNMVIDTVDCTLSVCNAVLHGTRSALMWLRNKLNGWKRDYPVENLPSPPPEVEDLMNELFPCGVAEAFENANAEDKKNMIENLVPHVAELLNIKNPPNVEFFVPDNVEEFHSLCGAYCHDTNTIKLNLAMIVSDDIQFFVEQISTVFHEMVHARQYEAVFSVADCQDVDEEEKIAEEYGYTLEYVNILIDNMLNYTTPAENMEAYVKQPLEAEAFYFESQIKQFLNT